jgi:starch synthase
MKLAFVASEAVPYAKTGGLADVVGTLPGHLRKLGVEAVVFLPKYPGIQGTCIDEFDIEMMGRHHVRIIQDGDACFIDYPQYYERAGLYGTEKGDFDDNCERFTLFCKAVTTLLKKRHFDVVHCHDWQSGLVPLYMREQAIPAKSVFTIHNLGYQGRFPPHTFSLLGIDRSYFTPAGIEYYGDINFLKAGVLYADCVTTVSENYAREIQTPELGFGLDGVLRTRRAQLVGILNGIDYKQWNPETDKLISSTYSDYAGKQVNKEFLVRECHLDPSAPLVGMVSRVAEQKGFDILTKAFDDMMTMGFGFVLLGFGDEQYHKKYKRFESVYRRRVCVNIKFDNTLAHRIYAGSDFFLMPSQYEPCGLGQLISLRYGTVPIVRATGGLADTVTDFRSETMHGNGFVFSDYTGAALVAALGRAHDVYSKKQVFEQLSEKCMTYDFSWQESAKKYLAMYSAL